MKIIEYAAAMALAIMLFAACAPAVKSALDIARGPAIDVLTKIIADRFGSDVNQESAYCEELPHGFKSGIGELDDNERGAFVLCWAEPIE